jgi:hypothetical protein
MARDALPPWRESTTAAWACLIGYTQSGSGRERAGLTVGDVVLAIDGRPVELGPGMMLPDRVRSLDRIPFHGPGQIGTVDLADRAGHVYLVPQVFWDVGFRLAAPGHPACGAMATATWLTQSGRHRSAAAELVAARRLGADGPWFRALQGLVAAGLGRQMEAARLLRAAAPGLPPQARRVALNRAAQASLLALDAEGYLAVASADRAALSLSDPALPPADPPLLDLLRETAAAPVSATMPVDLFAAGRVAIDGKGGFAFPGLVADRAVDWMVSRTESYHHIRLKTDAVEATWSALTRMTAERGERDGWSRMFVYELMLAGAKNGDSVYRVEFDVGRRLILVSSPGMRNLRIDHEWPWNGYPGSQVEIAMSLARIDLRIDGTLVASSPRAARSRQPVILSIWSEGIVSRLDRVAFTAPEGSAALPKPGPADAGRGKPTSPGSGSGF